MGQFLVFSNSPWFSSVSVSRSKTAFSQAGVSLLGAGIQETLRLLIDLLRMIYFCWIPEHFLPLVKWWCTDIFFFVMITGYYSGPRGIMKFKRTWLYIWCFELKETFCHKIWIHKVSKANKSLFLNPTIGRIHRLEPRQTLRTWIQTRIWI